MIRIILALLLLPCSAVAQLTLEVTSIPLETPEGSTIFVSGSFEGWSGGSPAYQLDEVEPGTWTITFDSTPGQIEFKFTRGSWDTVEGNENGGFLPNRTVNYTGEAMSESLSILSWEDLGGVNSTAAANVTILDTDFYIPQLDRYRRVWIYLPPDYETSQAHYKVLYMHDGQNVFDAATSFAGEWEVDETLNELFAAGDPGCIVVAVDNGGVHRLDEYSPWENPQYGGGEGELYMQFLVETLKPYIDENFRTLPSREWTGIMGSSMGGLISNYGGIEYSEVYSRIGSFSPAYWFSEESFMHAADTPHENDLRIYTIVGSGEGESMTLGMEQMEATYVSAGYQDEEHLATEHADGQHSEWYWAREFAAAYLWLWEGSPAGVEDATSATHNLRVWPNPAGDTIELSCKHPERVGYVQLLDSTGRRVALFHGFQSTLDIAEYSGALMVELVMEDGSRVVRRIVRPC